LGPTHLARTDTKVTEARQPIAVSTQAVLKWRKTVLSFIGRFYYMRYFRFLITTFYISIITTFHLVQTSLITKIYLKAAIHIS
jgi:hypothetical protein